MTEEEKPIVAVEPGRPDERARPPTWWTVRRIVMAAVTLTTLLGGLWTVIQLSDWILHSGKQEKLDAGWRRVQLQGGGSLAMPQTWDIVEKQALLAQGNFGGINQGLLDFMKGVIDGESSLSFIMEVRGPWPPAVAAVAAMRKFKWDEEIMIKGLRDRGFMAQRDSLNGRPVIHAIRNIAYLDSDPQLQLAQVIYFINLPREPWMLSYHVDTSLHLDYSGTFRRITESLKVE